MNESHHYRIAALKLHGLHPKDRKWLLGQFAPAQQGMLRELIQELDQLGFVSTEKISDHFTDYPVGAYPLATSLVAEINRTDPDTVIKILNGLPERLKAMILHAAHWQWSSSIWLKLEPQERNRLLRHIEQLDVIKAPVFSALIESLAEEIRQAKPLNAPDAVSRSGQPSLVDA